MQPATNTRSNNVLNINFICQSVAITNINLKIYLVGKICVEVSCNQRSGCQRCVQLIGRDRGVAHPVRFSIATLRTQSRAINISAKWPDSAAMACRTRGAGQADQPVKLTHCLCKNINGFVDRKNIHRYILARRISFTRLDLLVMFARLLDVARDRTGAAVAEFAIVMPVLMFGLLGVIQFGIVFYDYILVEDAAEVGERQFLQNRPFPTTNSSCSATCPTACFTPYTSTVSAVQNATNLPTSQLTINLSVAGAQCTSDSSCGNALCSAYSTTGSFSTAANTASVTVSYPCLTFLPVSWVPSFCKNGLLTSTITQRVD
jgi:Flp pilus assembly protein TadG